MQMLYCLLVSFFQIITIFPPLHQSCGEFIFSSMDGYIKISIGFCFGFAVVAVSATVVYLCNYLVLFKKSYYLIK